MTKNEILNYLKSIKPYCQQHGIDKIGLFGSYAKGKATEVSDIDIVIKLQNNFLDRFDTWEYFNQINHIKRMVFEKFQKKADVFDIDSTSFIKESVENEAIYV